MSHRVNKVLRSELLHAREVAEGRELVHDVGGDAVFYHRALKQQYVPWNFFAVAYSAVNFIYIDSKAWCKVNNEST